MNQTAPRFIGKRIRVERGPRELRIVITQQVERWQEALLIVWLAAWTYCGGVFLYFTFAGKAFSDRMFFAICSAVWMYFFVRIIKVFLWRKGGAEIIRLVPGKLMLRNAYWKRGKEEEFHLHQIFKLGLVKKDPASFLAFLDDSFWIIGGDRVGFSYSGQKVRLGKQLDVRDAEMLVRVIEAGMREFSKKPQ